MSNEGNTAGEALAGQIGTDAKDQEIAQLRATLAKYEGGERIVSPQFHGEVPRYKLNSAVFLEDDTFHIEGEEIEYLGTPNDQMVPLNGAARGRMEDYISYLTDCARSAAEANGRQYRGLITDHGTAIATALQDARRTAQRVEVVMPADKGAVPQMPHMETEGQKRARGRVPKSAKVVSAKTPPPPGKQVPQPVAVLGDNYTSPSARVRG